MGVVNPVLPEPGQPRGTEETDVRNALLALVSEFNGNIESSNLAESVRGLFMPVGTVAMTARPTANDGWLLCDGAAVSRNTYAALFEAVGTAFGAGDGLATFNLPDLRGRSPIGAGTAASPTPAGATAHAAGQKGGEETHDLEVTEIPAHSHAAPYSTAAGSNGTGSGIPPHNAVPSGGTWTSSVVGGGLPHNNMQPYTAINFQIKT